MTTMQHELASRQFGTCVSEFQPARDNEKASNNGPIASYLDATMARCFKARVLEPELFELGRQFIRRVSHTHRSCTHTKMGQGFVKLLFF